MDRADLLGLTVVVMVLWEGVANIAPEGPIKRIQRCTNEIVRVKAYFGMI